MFIGSLKNTERAETLHPLFKKVFDYIKSHDLSRMPAGRIDIDGDNAWISVSDVQGRKAENAKLETHNRYIDIQMPMVGSETFGWKERGLLSEECNGGYDTKNDITFYDDKTFFYFTLKPGDFGIFFAEDGHAPCIGQGVIKKVVAKVKI